MRRRTARYIKHQNIRFTVKKVCFICRGKGTIPMFNSSGTIYKGGKIVDNKCPACNGRGHI